MKKVLVVEDSNLIRFQLYNLLRRKNCRVFEATSIEQVKQNGFSQEIKLQDIDLILLDIYLGSENGLELLEYLSANYPHIPVLVMSVENKREMVARAIECGAKDYILKPFDPQLLFTKIDRHLPGGLLESEKPSLGSGLEVLKKNLSAEINRAVRSGSPLTVIRMRLKGKLAGGEFSKLYELIAKTIRDYDQIYTLSQSEFILVLPLTDREGAEKLLARLQSAVEKVIENVSESVSADLVTFPNLPGSEEPHYDKIAEYQQEILAKLGV